MVTVFTPVYNRKDTMEKLYFSLLSQSDKRFEWLIIDDGSTDSIDILIHKWKKEDNGFEIRYYWQENGGKHRAINKAVKLAQYEAFFIVDSDDYLTDDAVEFINSKFLEVENKDNYAGISGLKVSYLDYRVIGGNPTVEGYVDATNLERKQYGLLGDKAEVYKTEILKKYPFPEYEGENFLGEGIVWDHIGIDGYKIRWYNYPIYMCEYLSDGLTRNSYYIYKNNPKGWANYLVSKRIWGILSDQECEKEYFKFYERMRGGLSDKQIQELMKIDTGNIGRLKQKWKDNLEMVETFFEQYKIKTLALYGAGTNARRLLEYIEKTNVNVKYLIDRYCQYSNINYKVLNLEDDLPNVDCVCITLASIPLELKEELEEKMPYSLIVSWQDMGVYL